MRISRIVSIIVLLSIAVNPVVFALDTQTDFNATKLDVNVIQTTDPTLPTNVPQQKWRIGAIISRLFDANGKIGNYFLKALWTTRADGYILRWTGWLGWKFQTGSLFDTGTKVGIGTSTPSSLVDLSSALPSIGFTRTGGSFTTRNIYIASNDTFTIGRPGLADDFRISSVGKVGIGVANPAYNLDVSWDVNFSGNLYRSGVQVNFAGKFKDGTNPLHAVYTDGNVGIGTLTPWYNLDVYSTGNSIIRAYSNGGIPRLSLQSATKHFSQSVQGNKLYFYDETTWATRMVIDTTGNVGIGTASPSAKLQVNGSAIFGSQIAVGGNTNNVINSPTGYMNIQTYGGEDIVLQPAGNVGIGTTNPGATLDLKFWANTLTSADHSKGIRFGDQYSWITAYNFNPAGSSAYRNISFYTTWWDGSSVVTRDVLTIGNYGGNVGIGTSAPAEKLDVVGRISLSVDPNSGNDVGDRDYNDARYINVWETGDSIADNTIDSTEIQDNTITSADILNGTIATTDMADNAIISALILDGTITSADIANKTITNADIAANNSITANRLAPNSVGNSEMIDAPIFTNITATNIKVTCIGNCF